MTIKEMTLIFCCFLFFSLNSFGKALKIAIHYPKAGRWHHLGVQAVETANMALKKYQSRLTANKVDIAIAKFEYDEFNKQDQTKVANTIINDPSVIAVVSYMDHGFSKAKIPLITWNQRSAIINKKTKSTFRISLSDPIRQKIAANLISNHLKKKSVAILLDGSSFSTHYQHSLKEKLNNASLTVFDSIIIKDESTSTINNIADKILKRKPDIIINVGRGLQKKINALNIVLKKKDKPIPTLCLVDYPPKKIPNGLEYLYISLFDTHSRTKKDMDHLLDTYLKTFGKSLGGIGIYGYESSQLIFNAALVLKKKGKTINHRTLADELRQTNFTGITGKISFDQNGNRSTGEYVLSKRTSKKYHLLLKDYWPSK